MLGLGLGFGLVPCSNCYGNTTDVIFLGALDRRCGFLCITGMSVDLSIQLTLMFWRPSTNQEYVLFILATMWGVTDGIWQTQINSEITYSRLLPIS